MRPLPFFLILLAAPALAEPRSLLDMSKSTVRLGEASLRVELAREAIVAEPPGAKRLPRRVYLHFNKALASWTFVLSDRNGTLPPEALAEGAVLAGTRLGGDAALRYRLNAEKRWVPSNGSETVKVWVTEDKRPKPRSYFIPPDPAHASARIRLLRKTSSLKK